MTPAPAPPTGETAPAFEPALAAELEVGSRKPGGGGVGSAGIAETGEMPLVVLPGESGLARKESIPRERLGREECCCCL